MWWSVAAAQVVELPEEDLLASLRARALGGAITGLAESASTNLYNPAAVAVRRPLTTRRSIDPDTALQARDHPLITEGLSWLGVDPTVPRRSSWFQVGLNLRAGRAGFAAGWRETRMLREDGELGTFLASPGVGYAGDEVVVGLLPHVFGVQADGRGLAATGGASAGLLVAPAGTGLRAGLRARTPMRTPDLGDGPPLAARLPAELGVGATWGLGLTNTRGAWGPDRERAAAEVVGLLAADLVVTGGSGEAVVLSEADPSSATSGTTVAGHLGGELWASRDRLRVRGGGGWLPGRGPEAPSPYVSAGVGWQVLQDPRGFGWRLVTGGEWYATGPAIGVGLETW